MLSRVLIEVRLTGVFIKLVTHSLSSIILSLWAVAFVWYCNLYHSNPSAIFMTL